jgi:hypothetical protein
MFAALPTEPPVNVLHTSDDLSSCLVGCWLLVLAGQNIHSSWWDGRLRNMCIKLRELYHPPYGAFQQHGGK